MMLIKCSLIERKKMDPINLGIKFVKASQPGPDVPGTDVTEAVQNVSGNGAGGLTQTGD